MKTKNLNFQLNKEKCVKCSLCIKDCIVKIIKPDADGYPTVNDENYCIGCQHCLAICPKGAISVFDKKPEDVSFVTDKPSAEQMETLIKSRRSCRHFKQENLDNETLEKLKDIINWAPTGVNFRNLHFSIVENIDTMKEIKSKIYNKLKFILKFVPIKGHFSSYKKAIMADEDVIFRNAPHMIIVSTNQKAPCKDIDPIIALSYFELYAQSLGLGTLWCGLAYMALPISKEVMHKLEIPKSHKLSYVMLFGKPDINYKRAVQPDKYKITVL